jgi:hypothetical protein
MPWQQLVADVVLEIDADTGRLAYEEFGLTVPRQSGKSTWVLAKATHRCSATGFFGSRQRLVYTAQTRQKAREKWDEDYAAELEQSAAFKNRVRALRPPGNEHLRFANGSRWGIEANTEKAGHGGTLDEAYIDEAFAQVDFRLEQAFGPAMITRLNKQLGWISTAGWLGASPFLEQKVRAGRAAVAEGRNTGLAYFEWSAPEDCDPGDPDVWAGCMPALGHTITVDAIRGQYDKAVRQDTLNDFKRAYLNIWVPKPSETAAAAIDLGAWGRTESESAAAGHVTAFAVATDPDRAWSAIGAAGPHCICTVPEAACAEGLTHVELVDHLAGTGWIVDRCVYLNETHGPARFVVDGGGPAASLITELEQAGLTVVAATTKDVARSYGLFMDALAGATLRHGPDSHLLDAVKAAKTRPCGDGGQAFGRKASGSDITPLEVVSLAHWAAVTQPRLNVLNSIW